MHSGPGYRTFGPVLVLETAKESDMPTDTKSQHQRFVETARSLSADEDEAAFRAKLAVIARQKPKDAPPPDADVTAPKRQSGRQERSK